MTNKTVNFYKIKCYDNLSKNNNHRNLVNARNFYCDFFGGDEGER